MSDWNALTANWRALEAQTSHGLYHVVYRWPDGGEGRFAIEATGAADAAEYAHRELAKLAPNVSIVSVTRRRDAILGGSPLEVLREVTRRNVAAGGAIYEQRESDQG